MVSKHTVRLPYNPSDSDQAEQSISLNTRRLPLSQWSIERKDSENLENVMKTEINLKCI